MAVLVSIRVRPRAARDRIDGFREGVLHVRVGASPVGGEANEAVIGLLAKAIGVGRTRLSIVRGRSSRDKTVAVEGMSSDELRARLGGL